MLKLTSIKDIKTEIISKVTTYVDAETVCFYDEDREFYFFTITKWMDMISNDKLLFKNYKDSNISNSVMYMKNPTFYISGLFGLNTTINDSLIIVSGMLNYNTYDTTFNIINSEIHCRDLEILKKADFIIHDCIIKSNIRLRLSFKHDLNKVVMDGSFDYVEFKEDNYLDNVKITENDVTDGVETVLFTASKIKNLSVELNRNCESFKLFACEIDNCVINNRNGDVRLTGCNIKDTNFNQCILDNFSECKFNKCDFTDCRRIKFTSDVEIENCSFIGCKIDFYGNNGLYKNIKTENCIVETTYRSISDIDLKNKKIKNKDVEDLTNIFYYTDATQKTTENILRQSYIILVLFSNKIYSLNINETKRNLTFLGNVKKQFRSKIGFYMDLYTANDLPLLEIENLFQDVENYKIVGKSTISKTSKTFEDNMFGYLVLCDNDLYVLESQNNKFVESEIDNYRKPNDPFLKNVNKKWDEYANVEKYHQDIIIPLNKNFLPYLYHSETRFETFNSNYEIVYIGDKSQTTIHIIFKHPSNSTTLTLVKMKIKL